MYKLLFGVLLGVATNVSATALTSPPVQYQLKDLKISVIQQTSHGLSGSYQIEINGSGEGYYQIDKTEPKQSSFQNEALMKLLNEFYRIHFFELQNTWLAKKSVVLSKDNIISTIGYRLVDVGSKTLCIELSDYKKCISVTTNQLPEVNELIKKIETLVALPKDIAYTVAPKKN